MTVSSELVELVSRELQEPVPEGAMVLARSLVRADAERGAIDAILFYGSNFRRRDDREGVLDFYVLVRGYGAYYGRLALAFANWLLPPNVFYVEQSRDGETLRAKYAVVSVEKFRRSVSERAFHPYFWARFSQPCALLYARDAQARRTVTVALAEAVRTFVVRSLPLVPEEFSSRELWVAGFRASYGTELRSEREDVAEKLFAAAPARYREVTGLVAPAAGLERLGADRFRSRLSRLARSRGRWAWRARAWLGKGLSLLRILKGWVTFRGGVDYVLWKIERHSGIRADRKLLEGRFRIVGLARVFWDLFRRGAFR
ncbi:MAG: hypothetical protein KatS3mg076_3176 [Candidatus Binatia bacterium]|nr:MAG: hypothetical protein KatS3mg076_3176 [Candidatus Binatia bacterium]